MSYVEWGEIELNVRFSGLGYFPGFIISVVKISKVGLVQFSEYDPVPFLMSHGIIHHGIRYRYDTGPVGDWSPSRVVAGD